MSKSFKITYKEVVHQLIITIKVQNSLMENFSCSCRALIDTGAQRSMISNKVFYKLRLNSSGLVIMNSANARSINYLAIVNFVLPNSIVFNNINAIVSNLPPTIDAIIGINLICQFDGQLNNAPVSNPDYAPVCTRDCLLASVACRVG